MTKPRLTDRVLRGLLKVEQRCGGPLERCEMKNIGHSVKDWDEAEDALQWVRQMIAWRKGESDG